MASLRRQIRLLQSLLCCGVCSVCCGSGGGWRRDEELGVGTAWARTMDCCLERATESDCLADADRSWSPSPAERGTRYPADMPGLLTGSLMEEEEDERSLSHARTVSSIPQKSSSSFCMVDEVSGKTHFEAVTSLALPARSFPRTMRDLFTRFAVVI